MQSPGVHQQYIATQVSTADRLQLVVMLYDGAVAFLKQAQERMAQKDTVAKGRGISKALDIIAELNASINFQDGKEVAANLFHLYNFLTAHLTKANLNWDQEALEESINILSRLRDAWEEVCRKARRGELAEPDGLPHQAQPRKHLASLKV